MDGVTNGDGVGMEISLSRLARISRRAFREAKNIIRNPDSFLKHVSGIIHVGANTGQERELYVRHNLNVIWIEPIPEVFSRLKENIAPFPLQQAYQYLITDRDNNEYDFHVANLDASSSILDLNLHKQIWEDIYFNRTIKLKSMTLTSFVEEEHIKTDLYDALIMDTQGSELLVLKGAEGLLDNFRYIKLEVADFESYSGCCKVKDIEDFLNPHGFKEISRDKIVLPKPVGAYYDIVYRRVPAKVISHV